MRGICFGAIWLTGFLAVLLSWGMMWGRAKGEGLSRLILTRENNYRCQLEAVIPELGFHELLEGPTLGCIIFPIGWSNGWFYFREARGDLARINQTGNRRVFVAEDSFGATISPDGHYLINVASNVERVFTTDLTDGTMAEIRTFYLSNITDGIFSPSGEWVIVRGSNWLGHDWGYGTFMARLDGSQILVVPVPENENLIPKGVIFWTDSPEWLVLLYAYSPDGIHILNQLYKMRPSGSYLTLMASSDKGPFFSGWVHPSGIIGLLTDDTFSALQANTGQVLWQLEGVKEVLTHQIPEASLTNLAEDYVHFRMTDGRLARCRVDGSDLAFYDIPNLRVIGIWGWSHDGEWVWIQALGTKLGGFTDIVRVQRDTGKIEEIIDEDYVFFDSQSLDGHWVFFRDGEDDLLYRIDMNQPGTPLKLSQNPDVDLITSIPPYQAEWQPTHTLIIGIGLMSFSTLTPIVLWRRRRKQRTA